MGRFSMESILVLCLVVGVPVVLNWFIVFRRFKNGWLLLSVILFTVSFVITDIFVVRWSWYSYWALFGVVGFTALAVLFGLFKFPRTSWKRPHTMILMSTIFMMVGAVYLSVFNLTAWNAAKKPDDSVSMRFPMRHGTFSVIQGGAGAPLQDDHLNAASQKYAVDLVAINEDGISAGEYLNAQMDGLISLGTPVYAPCSGQIVWAENAADQSSENPAGNGVAIACEQALVTMAHLQKGSLEVRRGQDIKAGQMIGRIGRSGHGGPIHLHLHAEKGEYQGYVSDNPPISMTFDGKFLWKNRILSN